MCSALEVHLLAAPYVPACVNISLVTCLPSWSNSYIHHMVLTSFLSTWYEHWRNPWFLSASTKGIPFWSQPPWLEIRDEVWQVGNVENHRPVEGRWVLGPLCSAWGCFLVEVFGKFYESCGHRNKLRRNKRTSEIFRWWLFQYGSLEGRNSWTTLWWNGSWLKFWASWRVGFGACFVVMNHGLAVFDWGVSRISS